MADSWPRASREHCERLPPALNTDQKDALGEHDPKRLRKPRQWSGHLYRPMIVAMSTMGMVQPSIHEVIDVVAVRYGFVSARRAMLVRADRLRCALHGIDRVDCNGMLINVIPVRMMQMAIMKIIDMVVMSNRRMPTVGTMCVAMVAMMLLGAGSHSLLPFRPWFRGSQFLVFGCIFHRTLHQTPNVNVRKRIVDVLGMRSFN